MLQKIGMREFRNNLAKYLSATDPVAVTRHGQTVGYFLPTHQKTEKAELEHRFSNRKPELIYC